MHALKVAVLSIALSTGALAAESAAPATESVEAEGQASIEGGNKPLARDRATQDALRRAVEQVSGTLVQSFTEVERSQLVKDKILSQAKGYVSSYEVLSSKDEGGVVSVKVIAKVGVGKLSDDLAAIGMTLARKGMPRLALLIAEQRIDEVKPAAWWGTKAGALSVDQRVAENTLLAEWTPKGFSFVEPQALAGKVQVAGVVSSELSSENIRQLGSLSDADVVIVGSAVSTKTQDASKLLEGMSAGAKEVTQVSCSATVSARAFNADSAEILTSAEATASAFNQSALSCGRDATVKATKELSGKLESGLLAAWNKQLAGTGRVRMKVAGVDSLKTLNALKAALTSVIRGVQSVDQRAFGKGQAELDLRADGTAESIATALEGKKLNGRTVTVVGLTANTIDLELAK